MISGYVEVIERGSIRGWAFDSKEPARRLRVELLFDNFPVAQAAVDIPRPDLAALDIGRTDFAFDLRVPADVILDLSRLSVRPVGEQNAITISDKACALEGAVEMVSATMVSGWVWHVGYPSERMALELRLDNAPIAAGLADGLRADLAGAHIGDGKYGFRFPIDLAPGQIAPAQLKVIEQRSGQPLIDLRLPLAVQQAAPRIVLPAKPVQVVAPAPAPRAAPRPAPRPVPVPTPVAQPIPQPAASAPVPQPAPPTVETPAAQAGKVRIEQEPGTVTLSREAAEALRHAMGLSSDDDDSIF